MILDIQVQQLHSLQYMGETEVLHLSTLQVAAKLMLEKKETVLSGEMTAWVVCSSR